MYNIFKKKINVYKLSLFLFYGSRMNSHWANHTDPTNGECISLPVFTQIVNILNIYCLQLHK